jgi:hypothetical protein
MGNQFCFTHNTVREDKSVVRVMSSVDLFKNAVAVTSIEEHKLFGRVLHKDIEKGEQIFRLRVNKESKS